MDKGKFSSLKKVHMCLMVLLCLVSIASAIIIFTGKIPTGYETSGAEYRTTHILYGIAHVVNALALHGRSVLYDWRFEHSRSAAGKSIDRAA